MVAQDPTRYTLEQYKNERQDPLFIDVSLCANRGPGLCVARRNGAPVSVPLEWAELRKKEFRSDGVTMRRHARPLDKARRKLETQRAK